MNQKLIGWQFYLFCFDILTLCTCEIRVYKSKPKSSDDNENLVWICKSKLNNFRVSTRLNGLNLAIQNFSLLLNVSTLVQQLLHLQSFVSNHEKHASSWLSKMKFQLQYLETLRLLWLKCDLTRVTCSALFIEKNVLCYKCKNCWTGQTLAACRFWVAPLS